VYLVSVYPPEWMSNGAQFQLPVATFLGESKVPSRWESSRQKRLSEFTLMGVVISIRSGARERMTASE
jgi:hypothetical protein